VFVHIVFIPEPSHFLAAK